MKESISFWVPENKTFQEGKGCKKAFGDLRLCHHLGLSNMRFRSSKNLFIGQCEDEIKPVLWAFETTVAVTLRIRTLPVCWKISEHRGWCFHKCYKSKRLWGEFICCALIKGLGSNFWNCCTYSIQFELWASHLGCWNLGSCKLFLSCLLAFLMQLFVWGKGEGKKEMGRRRIKYFFPFFRDDLMVVQESLCISLHA